jgi:hypothetical protein
MDALLRAAAIFAVSIKTSVSRRARDPSGSVWVVMGKVYEQSMDTNLRSIRVEYEGNRRSIGNIMTHLKDVDQTEISILHTPHGIVVRAQGWLAVSLTALVGIVALIVVGW